MKKFWVISALAAALSGNAYAETVASDSAEKHLPQMEIVINESDVLAAFRQDEIVSQVAILSELEMVTTMGAVIPLRAMTPLQRMMKLSGGYYAALARQVTGAIQSSPLYVPPSPPVSNPTGIRGEVVPTPAQINNLVAQINVPLTVPVYVPPPYIPQGTVTIGPMMPVM